MATEMEWDPEAEKQLEKVPIFLRKQAREVLRDEHVVTPRALDSSIAERLLAWADMYRKQGNEEKAKIVDGMRWGYEFADIQF